MFVAKTKPTAYRSQHTGTFAARSQSFDPAAWAAPARELGAGEVVLTTRHHDSFALRPTRHPNAWTTADAAFPAGTDFVERYADAVRATGLRVGFYYSPLD
ncbi:hypothetical protein ATKI12_6489 [Kitasatospora sp. Ki12]